MSVFRRRGHKKGGSDRDIALVQMQIAAQARNQRWHEFLCDERDVLQARLLQQGYSHRPQSEQPSYQGVELKPDESGKPGSDHVHDSLLLSNQDDDWSQDDNDDLS